jgi:pimeloyl-ACP methyl ester carboxylesterase
MDERYVPASENEPLENHSFKTTMLQSVKDQLNNILFNEKLHVYFPSVTDFVIKHFFQELSVYFTKNCMDSNNRYCMANEIIRERLKSLLLKHKDKEILLIAHSMGTIIAYDLLMKLNSEIKIKTLITIGSPLTVPFIFSKIKEDSDQPTDGKAKTPECITKNWFNFADMNDKLAVNYKFEDMFEANKNGVIPKSAIVKNDYQSRGISNAHKSFGYLRTRQVAAIVDRFLSAPHVKFGKWIGDKFKGLLSSFKSKAE